MLAKCMNSNCPATFQYLHQGRLFRIDFNEEEKKNALSGRKTVAPIRGRANPIEHFWLCESCAATMTIGLSEAGEVHLLPLEGVARAPEPVPPPQTSGQREVSA